MKVLDNYVLTEPTPQNVLDLFAGDWSSQMPEDTGLKSVPGPAVLFNDHRLTWCQEVFGSFQEMNILELGPLEAAHSHMLQQAGAKKVVAIEANSKAFLKCLCVKEIFHLDRVEFRLGNFLPYLKETQDRFDLVLASGVLYHMMQPVELLELISRVTDRVFLWTHYYDEAVLNSNRALKKKFSRLQNFEHQGYAYQASVQSYKAALKWSGFCGGPVNQSLWLTNDGILDCLKYHGFQNIEINHDTKDHPHGPAFSVCASR